MKFLTWQNPEKLFVAQVLIKNIKLECCGNQGNAKSNIVTTLRTIEPYVLKALIKEDLHRHPMSKISEIASRIPDVEIKEIRKFVYSMVGTGIAKKGARVDCRYYLI